MKQKELEILLSQLKTFNQPKIHLEQYQTPPRIVAMITKRAFQLEDIEKKTVADFCSGTGLFGIAAKILGAKEVICYEIDEDAIELAKSNAEKIGVKIIFRKKDVRDVQKKFDTILMNSPFGIQGNIKDQEFLRSALQNSSSCYSIHLYQEKNIEFLKNFVSKNGKEVKEIIKAEFEIPKLFQFHTKKYHIIEIAILRSI